MTSKQQAEIAGDALLAPVEAERERAAERSTRPLLRFYPALKDVPPLERHAVLGEARGHAGAYVSSHLFLAALALGLAAVMVLGLTGRTRLAIVAGSVTGFLFIARQFVELMLMRRFLRNLPRKTSACSE
jgi:hypothetical protein